VKPYLVIGAIALIWAVLILRTKFPSIHSEHENESGDRGICATSFVILISFCVVAQFFYVGAQSARGATFHTMFRIRHQSEKIAGYFLTGTPPVWSRALCVAWLMRFIVPAKLMGAYCIANIIFSGDCVFGLPDGWFVVRFSYQFFMSLCSNPYSRSDLKVSDPTPSWVARSW